MGHTSSGVRDGVCLCVCVCVCECEGVVADLGDIGEPLNDSSHTLHVTGHGEVCHSIGVHDLHSS